MSLTAPVGSEGRCGFGTELRVPLRTQYYLSSTPACRRRSVGRPREKGRTRAQQLRAGGTGAGRVGVQVHASPLQIHAAARVVGIRSSSIIARPRSRGRTLARRLVHDPEIACRALVAAVAAPCIGGCTQTNTAVWAANTWTCPPARIDVCARGRVCTCNCMQPCKDSLAQQQPMPAAAVGG